MRAALTTSRPILVSNQPPSETTPRSPASDPMRGYAAQPACDLRFPYAAVAPRPIDAQATPFITTLPITSPRFMPVPAYGRLAIEVP